MPSQVPVPNKAVAVFLGYYNVRIYDPSDNSSQVVTVAGISRMRQHVADFLGAPLATPEQQAGAPTNNANRINPDPGGGAAREGTLHGKTAVVTTNLTDTKNKTDQFKSVSFPIPQDFPNSYVAVFLTNLNAGAPGPVGVGTLQKVVIDQGRKYSIGSTAIAWPVPDPA